MSGFTGSGASLDARAVRPKMQRRPGATYGTKARRIARPSSQTAEPSVATVTGSKTDAKSDDEDDEVKEPPAKRVHRASRAFTVARDAADGIAEPTVASTSTSKFTSARAAPLRNKSNITISSASTSDKYLSKSKNKIPRSDSLSSLDEDQDTLTPNLRLERLSIAALPGIDQTRRTDNNLYVAPQTWGLPIEDKELSDCEVITTSTPAANRNRQFTFTFPDLHAPTIPFLGDDTHLLSDDDALDVDTTVRAVPQNTLPSSTATGKTNTIQEQSMLLSSESNSTTDDELATMTNYRMGISAGRSLANHKYKKGSIQNHIPVQEGSNPVTESDTARTDEEEDGFASDEATQKTEKQAKEAQPAAAKKKQRKLRRKSKSKSMSPENYRSSSNSSNATKESKIKLKSAEKKKRSKVPDGNKMEVDGKTPATSSARTRKTRSSSSVSAKSQAIYGVGTSSSIRPTTTTNARASRSRSTTSSASSSTATTIDNQQGLKMQGSKGSLIRSTPVKAHSSGSGDELGF